MAPIYVGKRTQTTLWAREQIACLFRNNYTLNTWSFVVSKLPDVRSISSGFAFGISPDGGNFVVETYVWRGLVWANTTSELFNFTPNILSIFNYRMSKTLYTSCDLTPSDIFCLDNVKSDSLKDNPQPIPALKDEIIWIISEIKPQLCRNVNRNFNKRVEI